MTVTIKVPQLIFEDFIFKFHENNMLNQIMSPRYVSPLKAF